MRLILTRSDFDQMNGEFRKFGYHTPLLTTFFRRRLFSFVSFGDPNEDDLKGDGWKNPPKDATESDLVFGVAIRLNDQGNLIPSTRPYFDIVRSNPGFSFVLLMGTNYAVVYVLVDDVFTKTDLVAPVEEDVLILDTPLAHVSRTQGLYIVGRTGMGKSTLLKNLMIATANAFKGFALLDPHGDLVFDVATRLDPHQAGKVVYIDFSRSEDLVGINPFECDVTDPHEIARTAGQFVHVMEKLWEERYGVWGAQLAGLLEMIAYTAIENQGMTLADIPRLLSDQDYREEKIANVTNPIVLSFWENDYPPTNNREQREYRASTMRRLTPLLSSPLLRWVFSQKRSFDFQKAIDDGRIILINLPIAKLGDHAVSLLGSILVNRLLATAISRESREDTFYLYADEFHRFATPDFATLIDEARKFNVATTIAHQRLGQLHERYRDVPLGMVNQVIFQSVPDDAEIFAKQFVADINTGEIEYEPVMKMGLDGEYVAEKRYPDKETEDEAKFVEFLTGGRPYDRHFHGSFPQLPDKVPVYQGRPKTRLVSDVQAELANKIATLPPYRAIVRFLVDGEMITGITDIVDTWPERDRFYRENAMTIVDNNRRDIEIEEIEIEDVNGQDDDDDDEPPTPRIRRGRPLDDV